MSLLDKSGLTVERYLELKPYLILVAQAHPFFAEHSPSDFDLLFTEVSQIEDAMDMFSINMKALSFVGFMHPIHVLEKEGLLKPLV